MGGQSPTETDDRVKVGRVETNGHAIGYERCLSLDLSPLSSASSAHSSEHPVVVGEQGSSRSVDDADKGSRLQLCNDSLHNQLTERVRALERG